MSPVIVEKDTMNGKPHDLSSPWARGGHTSVVVGTKLFVFMGLRGAKEGEKIIGEGETASTFHPYKSHTQRGIDYGSATSDVYIYDLVMFCWNKIVCTGDVPEARSGHVTVLLDARRIFLFGGRAREGDKLLDDIFFFHTDEYRWEKLPDLLPKPKPRWMASAAVVNRQVSQVLKKLHVFYI